MGRFPVPDLEELPDDVRERIETETEDAGFTPNVFPALAYKPSHFRAFFAYHDALTDDTSLEREEVEMLVVTVSGVNDCLYCVVASWSASFGASAKTRNSAPWATTQYRQLLTPETVTTSISISSRSSDVSSVSAS